jgi:predicted pyridoxine 5'-phosphate oxidase superfamily flavin-nucleotide-binding protein
MNLAQQKHGDPHPAINAKIKPVMDTVVQHFIQSAPFIVMATSNANGDCDASPKGGRPGFVKVLDERTLLLPDIAGNKLFQSYENIESNPKAGLIFMIPGCGVTVRVNGRVSVIDQEALQSMGVAGEISEGVFKEIAEEIFNPDEKAATLQALRLEVDEVYPHCPRAFKFSRLWDTEITQSNADNQSDQYWYQQWAKLS